MRTILVLLVAAITVWVGAVAQVPSHQYLPADQGGGDYPDRQYLPAAPSQTFSHSNQLDDSRLDDEDTISVTSAAFGGSQIAPARFGISSSSHNAGSSTTNRFGGALSDQFVVPSSAKRFGNGLNQNSAFSASGQFGGGPSEQYGPPDVSSRLGGSVPSSLAPSASSQFRSGPSNQYGVPDASSRLGGSVPSSQYGAPIASNRFGGVPSSQYGAPSASSQFRSGPSIQYGVPDATSRLGGFVPSNQYGTPGNVPKQNGLFEVSKSSSQYGSPRVASRFGSGLNQNIVSDASSRFGGIPSKIYGLPDTSSRLGGPAPAGQYGAPDASNFRSSAPSNEYGAPGSNFRSQKGDEYSLSEPANYEFSYEVEANEYGTVFGQEESRQNENAHGSYHVLLPDGRTQIVEYEADQDGYKPQIRYEDNVGARGSGPY